MAFRRISVVVAAANAMLAFAANAQDTAPDIAALIECRGDVLAWGAVAFPLMEGPAAAEAMGWKDRASDNPFLKEYDLAAPVSVFGRTTSRIAVTASGPMAVLEGIKAAALAAELGIVASVDTPEKFLGEKVIVESSENSEGTRFDTRITLNVSTVDTHPGLTLAGCSYVLSTADAQ
jgi:hypothetical protein